jgi:hypothetical protein
MSNGARHGLGVVIGLVVTPVIALCLMYGTYRLGRYLQILRLEGSNRWLAAALLILAAVLIGLVAGSRVSPIASLIPGGVYALTGALWILAPRWAFENTARQLPRELDYGYLLLGPYGFFLLLGVALLAASLSPARWKAHRPTGAAPRFGGPPPAPMGPPPMPGAQAPMGAPQPPPAPGQSPPWHGAPQYGQPPAQPASPNPPALPSAPPTPAAEERPKRSSPGTGPDEDEPGEWTQMYGGNRPK